MNDEQRESLRHMCERFRDVFDENDFLQATPLDGLNPDWVVGIIGGMNLGCSPEGRIHT